MDPEAILAETPGNYTVALGDIVSVRMHCGAWDELHNQYHPDEMHIKTHRERTKLTFEYRNAPDARHLLKGLLGRTVR